jgi:hypothetical protein
MNQSGSQPLRGSQIADPPFCPTNAVQWNTKFGSCFTDISNHMESKQCIITTLEITLCLFLFQARNPTGVPGMAASGVLQGQTSWRVTFGSTRAWSRSSACSATGASPGRTTSPSTWRDTSEQEELKKKKRKKKMQSSRPWRRRNIVSPHFPQPQGKPHFPTPTCCWEV